MKTIGDEVMVVSPDAASLTEWAVDFLGRFPQRPQPRVGIHCGEAVYRDGDYFGSQVNLAHRVVNRALAGEVLVTDRVAEAIDGREQPRPGADRRGQPEGLPGPDRPLRRPRRRRLSAASAWSEASETRGVDARPDARAGARRRG